MAYRYAATLDHADWDRSRTVVRDSERDAETEAEAMLLSLTADFRDHDEYPNDEDWIEVCLEEDWTILVGIVVE